MKTTKPKLNVRLLRRIQKHILEEPRRFVMEDLVRYGPPGEAFESDNGSEQIFAECGTAACIAGWTLMLSGYRIERVNYLKRASELLSLGSDADEDRLFFADSWPEPFKHNYARAKRPATRAKIAAARIEHLITTGE